MPSSWDRLGQAASVMQVTGVDAFGLVSMIVQAAHTARRNRDLCQQLAQHVQIVGDLLRELQIPELRRHPETRRPLEQLDDALFRAYKLVRSCSQYQENSSQFYQIFTGADVASKLRAALEEIDRYTNLIPMITAVAAVRARGTEEVQEDVTNDPALAQRPRLSLQEVTESRALEELPPTDTPSNSAAKVMQVTGVDAFGLVSMIVQAAPTARRNQNQCQQLAQHVQIVGDLLRKLQIPELKRHPETRRLLEQLDDALFRAYKLVRSCSQYQENSSQFTGADVASKLRAALEEIDRYTHLIPMITAVAAVRARGTDEVQEDVTNHQALAQRPRLSLQEVTEFLALEELPPTGLPVNPEARRNDWHLMIENVRNGLVRRGRHLTYGVKGLFQEAHEAADIFSQLAYGTRTRRFSYNELSKATHGFSDKQKLGEGGFGAVYRGFFHDQGLHVAIKRVSKSNTSTQRRDYILEVFFISLRRHRNLVQLVGWCHKADELLLVYEFLTNGSLATHLYNSGNVLTWPIRYKIILGMGSALLYLHQECEQTVVHGDIKPSNVMLDSSLNAKLGDFGLQARLIVGRDAAFPTMPTGTLGYIDPRCMFTGRTSTESDVYSFGVVLLEIACGRQPIVFQEDESMVYLVDWVRGMDEGGSLLDAADARLNGEFEAHEMERALVLGLRCVHPDYSSRPSIWQAMDMLRRTATDSSITDDS